MPIVSDDIVASKGRIKTIQNGGRRFIEFAMARVVEVDEAGITVNPIGKSAVLLCRPEDLEVIGESGLKETPASRDSAAQHAEFQKGGVVPQTVEVRVPAGTIVVSGEVGTTGTQEEKPKDLKTLREKKKRSTIVTEDKIVPEPTPKPRPRRRRR